MAQNPLEKLTVAELLTLLAKQTASERPAVVADSAPPVPVPSSGSRLIPVTDWNKYHQWPPLGGLRWLIFNEKSNSFDKVVRRVGRRVLIDEAAFFEWVNRGADRADGNVIAAGSRPQISQDVGRKPGGTKRNR